MRWCRYSRDGETAFGVVEGEHVRPVEGTPFGAHRVTGPALPLGEVTLEVPVWPGNFYCVGVNYADHVRRMAAIRGKEPAYPKRPDIGYRSNNALVPHGADIVKPAGSGERFQYEGELVAVFGRTARNVSREEALGCVLGWTIGNDVSERDWQASDRTLWRAKNSDTFKPMGPWIETEVDLGAMETLIRVNGRETDRFATNNMIFDAATYISEVSRHCTIHPGDVMWMGTDGVPGNIAVGDVVEIEITGIGVLRNAVRAEGG